MSIEKPKACKIKSPVGYLQLCFCTLFLLASCNPGDLHRDFGKFTGRWTLDVVEMKTDSLAEWVPRQDHYKNRQGFIIYDGKGGMGVHHVTENYEKYQFEGRGGLDSLTRNDLRHLADNFVYFGKYRVDDSNEVIEHHIESANFPTRWGMVAKRKYQFHGDTLILNPITDRYPKTRLKWVRLHDMK